jgi:hypothetical protein
MPMPVRMTIIRLTKNATSADKVADRHPLQVAAPNFFLSIAKSNRTRSRKRRR